SPTDGAPLARALVLFDAPGAVCAGDIGEARAGPWHRLSGEGGARVREITAASVGDSSARARPLPDSGARAGAIRWTCTHAATATRDQLVPRPEPSMSAVRLLRTATTKPSLDTWGAYQPPAHRVVADAHARGATRIVLPLDRAARRSGAPAE